MRTIIAGSRDNVTYDDINQAMSRCGWVPTLVISGAARGADALGERWARDRRIEVRQYPADWKRHGKRAGFVRNIQMAGQAEALVAIWDGVSRGTRHMIQAAREHGLRVYVHLVGERVKAIM